MIKFDPKYLGHDIVFDKRYGSPNNPSYLICNKCGFIFLCSEQNDGSNKWQQSEDSPYFSGDWNELISCKDTLIQDIIT